MEITRGVRETSGFCRGRVVDDSRHRLVADECDGARNEYAGRHAAIYRPGAPNRLVGQAPLQLPDYTSLGSPYHVRPGPGRSRRTGRRSQPVSGANELELLAGCKHQRYEAGGIDRGITSGALLRVPRPSANLFNERGGLTLS